MRCLDGRVLHYFSTAGKPTVTTDDDSRFRYRQLGLFCKIAFRLTSSVLAYLRILTSASTTTGAETRSPAFLA